jgi:hypothetical protein
MQLDDCDKGHQPGVDSGVVWSEACARRTSFRSPAISVDPHTDSVAESGEPNISNIAHLCQQVRGRCVARTYRRRQPTGGSAGFSTPSPGNRRS